MSSPALHALDALCARLPFHLNDVAQVNEAFQRWQIDGSAEAHHLVDLWTYCFVYRYFLVKFMQEPRYVASDLDALVAEAFGKVEHHRCCLKDPSRYAHWVSVVCKNSFLNHLRARRRVFPLYETLEGPQLSEAPSTSPDLGFLTEALLEAIERLPAYLRPVAYLRFVENCDYEEIAGRIGRPEGSTRAYVSKIIARFRKDPGLRAFLESSDE